MIHQETGIAKGTAQRDFYGMSETLMSSPHWFCGSGLDCSRRRASWGCRAVPQTAFWTGSRLWRKPRHDAMGFESCFLCWLAGRCTRRLCGTDGEARRKRWGECWWTC